jgi:hypothetical protein
MRGGCNVLSNVNLVAETKLSGARFFRLREVCRVLGMPATTVRRKAKRGEIPSTWRGSHRVYPAERILALQRGGVFDGDEGTRDALAIEMLDGGASDAEVIRALKLPLERVRALRASLGAATVEALDELAPAAHPPSSSSIAVADFARQNAEIREQYATRRAELAARRRAEPEPPPTRKRKKT